MTIATRRALAPGELDHELIWGWVGLTSGVLAAFIIGRGGLPPIVCPFHAITGWPCPTCGATRAFAALVRGDLTASLRWHPLVAPFAALAAIYISYALAAVHVHTPRIRLGLADRDLNLVRVFTVATTVVVWAYLIADGR